MTSKDQFAVILVECEDDAKFIFGDLKNLTVRNTRMRLLNACNIVACFSKNHRTWSRKVLVG